MLHAQPRQNSVSERGGGGGGGRWQLASVSWCILQEKGTTLKWERESRCLESLNCWLHGVWVEFLLHQTPASYDTGLSFYESLDIMFTTGFPFQLRTLPERQAGILLHNSCRSWRSHTPLLGNNNNNKGQKCLYTEESTQFVAGFSWPRSRSHLLSLKKFFALEHSSLKPMLQLVTVSVYAEVHLSFDPLTKAISKWRFNGYVELLCKALVSLYASCCLPGGTYRAEQSRYPNKQWPELVNRNGNSGSGLTWT